MNEIVPGGAGATSAWKFKTAEGFVSGAEAQAEEGSSGTSIFDPVLCEVAYRWFSPARGLVLDPFAGGSVRGIVAAKLGRDYVGVDLSEAQVAANREQWAEIAPRPFAFTSDAPELVPVKVSAAMARLRFNGCDPEYIRTTCHASCCQSSTDPSGVKISIHPSEQARIEARGGIVNAGLLQSVAKRCPFKQAESELCGLHETPDKPFGCIASPFTLNDNGTLIVRNRYRLLKCYDDGQKIPAYIAFRASLNLIFGLDEAARICASLDDGSGDIAAQMPRASFEKLRTNDGIRKGEEALAAGDEAVEVVRCGEASWIVGDSRSDLPDVEADFIFSCPPYADLERYSDDPRDLSTLKWDEFRASYRTIIAAAVARLRSDRFACFVVGEVRGDDGFYLGLVPETIAAFEAAGARFYNEAILITAIGSLPIRAGRVFEAGRKVGKTHQNVLVFCKGDPFKATQACGPVVAGRDFDIGEPEAAAAGIGGEVT